MSHPGRPQNTMDLDSTSLQQALRDFETANARVLDLTQRLLRSEQERRQLADELERLRLRLVEVDGSDLPIPERLRRLGASTARKLVSKVSARLGTR